MKKISELKGTIDLNVIPQMAPAIQGIQQLDALFSVLAEGGTEVESAKVTVENVVLGMVCRALQIETHKPEDDMPYYWIQLGMECGGVLTMRSHDTTFGL